MYMVDTHCHILPGVDDGSRNMDMSLQMVEIAYSQGIRKMILTPHYYLGKTKGKNGDLRRIFEELNKQVKSRHEDMVLYLGNEVLWENGVIEAIKEGKVSTIADTKYVLVEFLPSHSYQEIYRAIRALIGAGYRPLVAHVERYENLVCDRGHIEEICNNGAYLQMNVMSFVGGLFDKQAKWCRKLIKEGYISVLGTDAHNLEDRAPYIQDALKVIRKELDRDMLEDILYKNAEKILEGKRL